MDPTYLEGRDGSLRAVNLEASLRNSAQGVFTMVLTAREGRERSTVECSSEAACGRGGGGVEQY